jgi:hypothetical protein
MTKLNNYYSRPAPSYPIGMYVLDDANPGPGPILNPGDKVQVADNDAAALPELEDSQDIGYTEIQW